MVAPKNLSQESIKGKIACGMVAITAAAATAQWKGTVFTVLATANYVVTYTAATAAGYVIVAFAIDSFLRNGFIKLQDRYALPLTVALETGAYLLCSSYKLIPLSVSPLAIGIALTAFVIYKLWTGYNTTIRKHEEDIKNTTKLHRSETLKLQQHIIGVEKKLKELKKKPIETTNTNGNKEEEIEKHKLENTLLQKTIEGYEELQNKSTLTIKSNEEIIQKLQSDIQQNKLLISSHEEKIKNLDNEKINSSKVENNNLDEELKKTQNEVSDLKEQIKEKDELIKNSIEQLKTFTISGGELVKANEDLIQKDELLIKSEENIDNLEKKIKETDLLLQKEKSQNENLTKATNSFKQQILSLKNEKENLTKANNLLNNEISELKKTSTQKTEGTQPTEDLNNNGSGQTENNESK